MKNILLLAAVLAMPAAFAADPGDAGSPATVITYHAAPANRVALRKALEEDEAPRLERWKREGVLKDARLLVNRHIDSATWDAMAILTFAGAREAERWDRVIEKETPAGLSPRALALVSAIDTAPAEIVRAGGKASAGGPLIVIPYEVTVPVPDYLAYLDGYVVPQMDGWMQEGVLASYAVALPRYHAGRPWQSLLVLEYRDDEALAMRDATTAKVRARLRDNPKWKAISDAKKNVRNEKAPVVADAIAPR